MYKDEIKEGIFKAFDKHSWVTQDGSIVVDNEDWENIGLEIIASHVSKTKERSDEACHAVLSDVRTDKLLEEILLTLQSITGNAIYRKRIINLIDNYKNGDEILFSLLR